MNVFSNYHHGKATAAPPLQTLNGKKVYGIHNDFIRLESLLHAFPTPLWNYFTQK